MAPTDSRVRNGTLSLTCGADSVQAACQAKNVGIIPDQDGGEDRVEVLCGDVMSSSATARDTLHVESIQDFTDTDGMQAFLWRNRGKAAVFNWQPTADPDSAWAGQVTVVAPAVGGDVATQLDYSIDLPILALTPPTGFGTGQIDPGEIVVITGMATAPTTPAIEWFFAPVNATLPANLAALKGHTIVGDSGSNPPSRDFTENEYVTLGDGSKAYFATATGWAVGQAPA